MPITTLNPHIFSQGAAPPCKAPTHTRATDTQTVSFTELLEKQVMSTHASTTPQDTSQSHPTPPLPGAVAASGNDELIPLGRIDRATPSISHLLTSNPAYKQEGSEILSAPANRNKHFTRIQRGTSISLNPVTKELVWDDSRRASRQQAVALPVSELITPGQIATTTAPLPEPTVAGQPVEASPVSLGQLDAKHPTLSHLLKSNPQFSGKAWEIIFAAVNRGKPFTSLRSGCQVSINPQTLELSFDHNQSAPAMPTAVASEPQQPMPTVAADLEGQREFSEKLAESVKAYLGQPYHEIDCYGLVVQGLKDQGVQYSGSGGLLTHLEKMATSQGMRRNAYQNGEGLIEIAGNKLYDQSFVGINDADGQSSKVMEELEPLLQEGMLLSFSTPFRGHTGVIAKKDGEWTYVNSGMIDHQIDGGKISKRVGEEKLEDEIKNWFKLARKRRTSLKVSAGLFDTEKLRNKGNLVADNKSSHLDRIQFRF